MFELGRSPWEQRRTDRVNNRSRWLALIAGISLALAMGISQVAAVSGNLAASLTVSGPSGTVKCGTPITLRVTVLNATGQPIASQPVDWAITATPSSKDTVNATPTITNASGVATTTVTLDCVVGQRTVTATADGSSGGFVLGVTSAGLPGTTTTVDGSPLGNLPIAPIAAFLAVLAGAGIIVRKFAYELR